MSEQKAQTFLVTGATGKTGRHTVAQLQAAGHNVRAGSRHPDTAKNSAAVKFDWNDPSTFEECLKGVSGVYLVAPAFTMDPLTPMKPFFAKALEFGVKRFVLLSGMGVPKGGPFNGAVHAYLADELLGAEYVVLQPNNFAQNFSETMRLALDPALYSASGEGRISFANTEDIAAAAVAALTLPAGSDKLNRAYVITGPAALTHGEVAAKISKAAGYEVKYIKMDCEGMRQRFVGFGMPPDYADILSKADASMAAGHGALVSDDFKTLTGKAQRSFDAYVESAKGAWARKQA